ncbi:hypothetical protein SAMN05660900_03017 [Megasphaera cerevisiae DSM 20462]|nr:hypothetical protein SAMN05660900_03017 [Megasphaera cerevisiae DSM 20462]
MAAGYGDVHFLSTSSSHLTDEDILDTTVLELIQHSPSVFVALIFTNFKKEYFFVTILMDAEHDIGGQLADNIVMTYRKVNGVNKDNGIASPHRKNHEQARACL